jgi:hypothetical protein
VLFNFYRKNKRLNRSARRVPYKEEVRCYNIMILSILSKNELRSSSGRIRYRVRVRAGIDYGVRCSRSCSLSAVLVPVRVFVVRCSHVVLVRAGSACVVPTLFSCADTSRLLYAALQTNRPSIAHIHPQHRTMPK